MWPTDILDTISLSLSIRVYDWSNKNAWIWTHLQCERFCLALITDCHSQKYIRSLRRPFFSTLIFQGHLEEPQRVSFSLAVPCPYLSMAGILRCKMFFWTCVSTHNGGASLCLQFFIILIYLKHARYIIHTVPVCDEKPKKKILKKKLFK